MCNILPEVDEKWLMVSAFLACAKVLMKYKIYCCLIVVYVLVIDARLPLISRCSKNVTKYMRLSKKICYNTVENRSEFVIILVNKFYVCFITNS